MEREPSFSTPGWTRAKGAILLLAAVLGGVGIATASHGDDLVGAVCVMAAGAAMFIAGVFVGHDIGQRYEAETNKPESE